MTMTRSPRHNRGTLALAALATCCSALANNRRFSEDPVGSACNINDGHIQEAGGMSRDQIVTDSASPRILNTPAQYVELNAATCIAGLQGMASAPQGITSMTTPAAAEINVGETSVGELAAANVALGLGGASAVSRMAVGRSPGFGPDTCVAGVGVLTNSSELVLSGGVSACEGTSTLVLVAEPCVPPPPTPISIHTTHML